MMGKGYILGIDWGDVDEWWWWLFLPVTLTVTVLGMILDWIGIN